MRFRKKNKKRYKIAVIGRGNVGSHLAKAFCEADCEVIEVSAREILEQAGQRIQSEHKDVGLPGDHKHDLPEDCDLYLLCVRDNAMEQTTAAISKLLSGELHADSREGNEPIIAHTSGSVSLERLRRQTATNMKAGVFYPMQTFSKNIAMDYSSIPFFIEGEDAETESVLRDIASLVSSNVSETDSKVREDYHLAAVFACNFSNHLCALAEKQLNEKGLDFNNLRPLIAQTFQKILKESPAEVQTGPASRRDADVISRQLSKLQADPRLRHIYSVMTESIMRESE